MAKPKSIATRKFQRRYFMEQELAYSFHLGSDKNKSKLAKKVAKENVSGTTSLANNAIQNAKELSLKLCLLTSDNSLLLSIKVPSRSSASALYFFSIMLSISAFLFFIVSPLYRKTFHLLYYYN